MSAAVFAFFKSISSKDLLSLHFVLHKETSKLNKRCFEEYYHPAVISNLQLALAMLQNKRYIRDTLRQLQFFGGGEIIFAIYLLDDCADFFVLHDFSLKCFSGGYKVNEKSIESAFL